MQDRLNDKIVKVNFQNQKFKRYQRGSKEVPKRDQKRYQRGTKEVPKRDQRGTKEGPTP